ncbi:MAG TPA: sigma-54 dependent transcriptional regulator [Rhodothermales bacterium]|nr:sigma-54 dependent transcriptional regulator [Rhodothermales bacterium]
MQYRFFVVDDDRHYGRLLSYRLEKDKQHAVRVFTSGEDVLAALDDIDGVPDLVLLDIMMPGMDGMEALKRMKRVRPDLHVVMVSAQGTVDVAIEAMKAGAADYITKGTDDLVKLDAVVKSLKERVKLTREVERLRGEVAGKYDLAEIVGESPAMEDLYRLIRKALRGNLTVAIQGESGTGKELVARAIHFNSVPRSGADGAGPFVVVNCAAIPNELMESEFFGHEKGSFTGAHARKIGKFEQADGGTIFLDEIGELDLGLQAKLLRALQNRELVRVGGNETITFDCRVISATNRDILEMVAEGTFREDLYYRLFQFPVRIPPLRERGQDVLVLAHAFLQRFIDEHPEFKGKRFATEAVRAVAAYAWPGNVRELKSVVERAVLISDHDVIAESDLLLDAPAAVAPWARRVRGLEPLAPAPMPAAPAVMPAAVFAPAAGMAHDSVQPAQSGDGMGAPTAAAPVLAFAESVALAAGPIPMADDAIVPIEELKRRAVEKAYRVCDGNVDRAAAELGIGRATMYRLLKKYEIDAD